VALFVRVTDVLEPPEAEIGLGLASDVVSVPTSRAPVSGAGACGGVVGCGTAWARVLAGKYGAFCNNSSNGIIGSCVVLDLPGSCVSSM
jgi:hypothetical protein